MNDMALLIFIARVLAICALTYCTYKLSIWILDNLYNWITRFSFKRPNPINPILVAILHGLTIGILTLVLMGGAYLIATY